MHTLISFKTHDAIHTKYRAKEDAVDCAILEENTNISHIITILMAADDFLFLKKALIIVSCSPACFTDMLSPRQTFLSNERQLK